MNWINKHLVMTIELSIKEKEDLMSKLCGSCALVKSGKCRYFYYSEEGCPQLRDYLRLEDMKDELNK